MSCTFLVELPDGTLVRKRDDDIKPEDLVVLDGPDAFISSATAQRELEEEIEAAGGLEAWRAKAPRHLSDL